MATRHNRSPSALPQVRKELTARHKLKHKVHKVLVLIAAQQPHEERVVNLLQNFLLCFEMLHLTDAVAQQHGAVQASERNGGLHTRPRHVVAQKYGAVNAAEWESRLHGIPRDDGSA